MSDPGRTEPAVERDAFVRWSAGCAIAAAATIGLLILVFMLFLAIEPPAWVQIVIGVGLAAGGAGLSWAIAAGLGRRPGATRRVAESGESTTRRKGRSA